MENKTFGDYYSEDECLELFDTTKYKFRKLIPEDLAINIAGNGKVVYPAPFILGLLTAKDENDQETEKRIRKVDVNRRERETFLFNDYVGINELLQYAPHSRERVRQVVKSTTKHTRAQLFNQWFYYKPFFREWLLNEGRINLIKSDKSYLLIGYDTFEDWLKAVQEW